MVDRREHNVEIFKDSMQWITEHAKLKAALKESIQAQELFLEIEEVKQGNIEQRFDETKIVVSKKRSFEAASSYARAGKKVAVLNFASATNPGGGVKHGSSAQEEALCRCSTLYPCLEQKKLFATFYGPHRSANNPLYNNDCIYTPGIVVFKSDVSYPERMKETDWYTVDVITCAAPNLRERPSNRYNLNAGKKQAKLSNEELLKLQEARIARIFEIAAQHKVDVLILGAFGCGAFCNPPEVVAQAFSNVQKKYKGCIETIEYAIYCRDYESANYDEFCRVMG